MDNQLPRLGYRGRYSIRDMEIATREVASVRIIVVSLNEIDFERAREGPRKRNREFYSEFEKMLRSEIYSCPSKRLDPPPHVIIDATDTNATLEEFSQWILPIVRRKSDILLNHRGKTVFCGIPGKSQWWTFEPTLESAIHRLTDSPIMESDLELSVGDKATIQNLSGIYLAGCPDNDMHELVEDFSQFELDVQHGPPAKESDFVIFCVSTTNGVSDGTKLAVEECRNCNFQPLCIILTSSLLTLGDSLAELVEHEAIELISTIIDSDQAHELPVLQDIDPTLVSKIVSLMGAWPTEPSI